MSEGKKHDGGKLRYDLVSVLALEDMVKGLTYGTIKYDDNNWIKVPEGRKRYLAASIRHIQEYRKGNLLDEETGTHHLSCAANNLMFIVEKDLQGWEDVPEVKERTFTVTPEYHLNGANSRLDGLSVSKGMTLQGSSLKSIVGGIIRMIMNDLNIGDSVNVDCGTYVNPGVLLSVFRTLDGDKKVVVEHTADGGNFQLIYNINKIVKVSHGLNFDMMGG